MTNFNQNITLENGKNIRIFFSDISDGNIAYHTGDDPQKVDKRRKKLAQKYSFDINSLQYMEQIHSNIVKTTSNINPQQCDAVITDKIDTPLMVMVADCIPILFFDETKNIIAAAHAGRNGTFNNISSNVVDMMKNKFDSKSEDIKVILGPSIQKCCYEVSQELAVIAENSFGKEFVDKRYLDLQGINKKQLLDRGIKDENISISKICTKCSGKNYFSYRDDNSCGRFAGFIVID